MKRLHAGLPGNVLLVLDAAYAEYVRRNDYASGVELAAEAENVVMTRTFSKIFGLANLRVGWAYGPARSIDALNRTRGPFNVNGPALAAGGRGARRPRAFERAVAHNADWLEWLSREIAALGLRVTPSIGNFLLVHFPDAKGRGAAEADVFLRERGLVLRRVGGYGFPNALRMTVGTRGGEPACRRGAADFWVARVGNCADLDATALSLAGEGKVAARHESPHPPPRADRHRADRLVDRARRAPMESRRARSSCRAGASRRWRRRERLEPRRPLYDECCRGCRGR